MRTPKSPQPNPSIKMAVTEAKQIAVTRQWAIAGDGKFKPIPAAQERLAAGAYKLADEYPQGIIFNKTEHRSDELLVSKSTETVMGQIITEIEQFWSLGKVYSEAGFLHRRGYLMSGKPGTGKTCIVKQVVDNHIANDGVVFICDPDGLDDLLAGIKLFRKVEPTRRILVVFEEIDALCEHSEESLLQFLDGEDQIENLVVLAATNHIKDLPSRIVGRPRRFDMVVEVAPPDSDIRRQYFTKKGVSEKDLANWVDKSEGFTFAGMSELVISVKLLNKPFEKALSTIKALLKNNEI